MDAGVHQGRTVAVLPWLLLWWPVVLVCWGINYYFTIAMEIMAMS